MNESHKISYLESKVDALRREKAEALRALELAGTIGDLEISFNRVRDRRLILSQTSSRLKSMIAFNGLAFYLLDEETSDFIPKYWDDQARFEFIDQEVGRLIENRSFAFCLERKKPGFFLSEHTGETVFLHPVATSKHLRGMFVGVLDQGKEEISDVALALFSLVLLSCVHALEISDLNLKNENAQRNLERQVEERTRELKQSNEQFRTIIASLQAGVVLIDYDKKQIVEINPAALGMIGRTREEVVGRACFGLVCPSEVGQCPLDDAASQVYNAEKRIETKDGRFITILKNVVPVIINGRKYVLESFADITQQKLLAQLREDVDRITRHDLKTPLNGVINLPELMLMDEGLSEKHRSMLKMIMEAGYKMLRLINFSHDLYRMETGSYDYRPVMINLIPIIRNILTELEDLTRQKNIGIEVIVNGYKENRGDGFLVKGEELLFYSLLSNIIKNALEASSADKRVVVTLDNNGETIIKVSNHGVIHESIRPIFFDKYVTYGKSNGTGLGTYSAKLIAETMGGEIDYKTSEEKGTCIIVRFR